MRTKFRTPEKYEKAALEICRKTNAVGEKRPLRFIEVMKKNRGIIAHLSHFGPTDDGLERKNPLVVALGDSVTAGHFENVDDKVQFLAKADRGELTEKDIVEVTDARECYLERFRMHLIDKFEQTSVSVINSGIAGDTMYGMKDRLWRDVIRYQPDLVIINGSLNWGEECGDTEDYKKVFLEVVRAIKAETKADTILLTPNMDCSEEILNSRSSLENRIDVIRTAAKTEDVCIADAYRIWEIYKSEGYPLDALLANGANHPSTVGHEIYAQVLMQLMC